MEREREGDKITKGMSYKTFSFAISKLGRLVTVRHFHPSLMCVVMTDPVQECTMSGSTNIDYVLAHKYWTVSDYWDFSDCCQTL